MNNQSKEEIRRMTFGKFDNNEEEDYEKETVSENEKRDIEYTENKEAENSPKTKRTKAKRQSFADRLIKNIIKEKETEIPEKWTGQTSVLDVIAPSSVDNGSRDYVVVDGIYHSYLYIAGYGYRTRNEAAWLSPLVEAGDNIGISFTFKRLPREKILSRISQKTMLNRSRMREVGDTRQDFEELDDAISSGFYLKEGMNRAAQDFYYMTTVIEVTAYDEEELEQRVADVMTLCSSMSMVAKRADYKHEQCFLSSLPVLSVEPDIERKARRNVLTDSLAASFPFSSFEVYDEGGIFLGLNKYNRSVAILDIFDSDKYANANGCIYGTTGAGKTFLLQNMALRFRMQGTQVFIIAPVKGHEYIDACEAIGGKYIKIAPSSKDCINIMEIRKTSLSTDYEIKEDTRGDSILAEKLQNLMIFFTLIKSDIKQDELNLLDSAVIRTYDKFGINFENKSLFISEGKFKKMPTLKDLYEELLSKEETRGLALMIEKFATGSLASFGRETNVDLNNKYIVLDMYSFKTPISGKTPSSKQPIKIAGDIEITQDGWLKITLNSILPNCRHRISSYISDTINKLLESYPGTLPYFDNAFMAIVEYCNKQNHNALDNDNKAWKMIPNTLKGRIIEDDNQFILSIGLFAVESDDFKCEVYFLPLDEGDVFMELLTNNML